MAIVCCVHSLWRMLPAFLAHHRALGVSRFFIYSDRCPPEAADLMTGRPDMEHVAHDRIARGLQNVEFQMRCADAALARCRQLGIDWLLHIDPDEFAWPGLGHTLVDLVREIPGSIEQVTLETREALTTPVSGPWRFWEQTYVWSGTPAPRELADPNTGERIRVERTLGHALGKSIGRVSADIQAGNSHTWTRRTGERLPPLVSLPTLTRGEHVHYVLFSAEQFLEKYRAFHPDGDTWPRGNPKPFPKQAWIQWSVSATPAEVETYLRDWVWMDSSAAESACGSGHAKAFPHIKNHLIECGLIP